MHIQHKDDKEKPLSMAQKEHNRRAPKLCARVKLILQVRQVQQTLNFPL